MFNSKDIYDPEWLDLVFENRNKNYGAYELRKNYADTMLRSIAFAVIAISVVFAIAMLAFNEKVKAITIQKKVDVSNKAIHIIPEIIKTSTTTTVSKSSSHTAYCGAISTASLRNRYIATSTQTIPATEKPSPTTDNVIIAVDNNFPDIHPATTSGAIEVEEVDVKPLPVGGAQEWSRFLEINLRYPAEAKQQHLSGRPMLTFIVERDGHITNITVDHPAGHGFDEEAIRVLKLSPPWTPALQNGQPVRVKYSLPVDFYMVK